MKKLIKFLRDEEGLEMVEWGLMAALFALALAFAIGTMATGAGTFFNNIGSYLGAVVVP